MTTGLIAALDTTDLEEARRWALSVAPHCGMLKLGLEFFLAHGAAGYRAIGDAVPIFLDLKLHDIPNTVAGGVRAVLPLRPAMLTIRAKSCRRASSTASTASCAASTDKAPSTSQ